MNKPAARKGDPANHKKGSSSPIVDGSGNVWINNLKAARKDADVSLHGKKPEPIAQGSGSVFINNLNAARKGDKMECGGEIAAGSPDVFIGDGAAGTACSICPAGVVPGTKPVNPLLGAKVLFGAEELDFALPGALGVTWQRHYSSYIGPAGQVAGLLGHGWRLPFEMYLTLDAEHTRLFDTKNRTVTFPALAPGEQSHSPSEDFTLMRGGPLAPQPGARTEPADVASPGHTRPAPPKPWALDERWHHVPPVWKAEPHYLLAGSSDRSVFLFAALNLQPTAQTPWVLIAILDVFGRMQKYHRHLLGNKDQPKDLPRGHLLAIEDPLGRRFELRCVQLPALFKKPSPQDNGWRLQAVSLNGSVLVRYGFDGGHLVQITDRHGRSTREFGYDAQHRIIRHRHLGGPWASYAYASQDPAAKVVRHDIQDGLSFSFDHQKDQTLVTDRLKRQTIYAFEGEGGQQKLTKRTDALGHTTQYIHGQNGLLMQEVNPLGQRTTYRRDGQGRVTSVQGVDGSQSKTEWVNGQIKSITGPDGSTTHFEHDAYGRLLQVTDALGHSTAYHYADPRDEKERPTAEYPRQIVDAKGGIKNLAWTRTGQLARYTDCSGHSTHYRYDAWGEMVEVTNALGETLHHERNALGLVSSTIYPDGSRTQYRYDARGQLSCITDALGGQTRYERDRHGRIVQSLASAAPNSQSGQPPQTLAYRYDAVGRLTALVNENGAVTSFAYDVLDRLVQETGFDGRTQRYAYDAAGQLIQSQDCASAADGAPSHTTRYIYDPGGHLVERHVTAAHGHWAATAREEHHFEYDQAGRLVAATTHGAQATQVHLKRDALGHIEEESLRCQDAASDTVFSHSLRHRYDPLGNRISTQQPHAGEIDYLSYGSGHVHQIALNKTALLDIERDALHRETQRRLLVGSQPAHVVAMHRTYDSMGRLVRLDADGPQGRERHHANEPLVGGLSRQYRYDALGLLIGIDRPGLRETRYGYDAAHRLVHASEWQHTPRSVDIPGLRQPSHDSRCIDSQAWFFDPAGNRVESLHSSRVMDNRIDGDAQHRYEYDPWGNVSRIEHLAGPHRGRVVLLAYDALHQLRVSQTRDPQDQQFVAVHYHYDAMGRRIDKRRVREGKDQYGQTLQRTCYGWDGDRLITTQTPDYVMSTIYEPGSFVPLLRIDTKTDRGSETYTVGYHYHCNHLGTPMALIAQTGEVVWGAELDPWGITKSLYNPQKLSQPIRMQGQQLDLETGLLYNRYRYYDLCTGRYATQDPIGLEGDINKFAYVNSNPLSGVDPVGLEDTLVSKSGPRYGNWGGKDWSGGLEPSKNGGNMGNAPPVDSVDACAEKHDKCWDAADGSNKTCVIPENSSRKKDLCDSQFVSCLKSLDFNPKKWPMPPRKDQEGDAVRFLNGGIFLGEHNFFRH